MKLIIDDSSSVTKLTIMNGEKMVLKKKGKSIKELLKFMYEGTKKESIKSSIQELQHTYRFMVGSITTIKLKD